MKLLTLLVLMIWSLHSFAKTKRINVNLSAEAVVLKVKAACVARVDFEGEGDYFLYYDAESFKEVAAVEKQGLTTTYLAGDVTCNWLYSALEGSGGNLKSRLTYVDVGLYDKASAVDKAIQANGGYKEIEVVYYNYKTLEDGFKASVKSALESMF